MILNADVNTPGRRARRRRGHRTLDRRSRRTTDDLRLRRDPVTLHLARLAHGFGARLIAITARADSTLANLADAVVDVSTGDTSQFGGTLFEQSALLLLDAMIYELAAGTPQAYATLKARHTNLQ
jgi:DNA-binding MurR/RpiR family transcriptional regulator